MKKISLTETEVNELVDLYQTEIDRAQRRILNLKALLKKLTENQGLSGEEKVEDIKSNKNVKSEPKKRGRKPNTQKTVKAAVVEDAVKKISKRGRKPKVKAETQKVEEIKKITEKPIKKRGRKPKSVRKSIKKGKGEEKVKWIDLIYDILRAKKTLMLSNSLTLAAMERLNIPEVDRDRVRMAISTNLTRLTKYDKTLNKYTQEGTSGSFYGLAEWFDDKGKLKAEFKNKLM